MSAVVAVDVCFHGGDREESESGGGGGAGGDEEEDASIFSPDSIFTESLPSISGDIAAAAVCCRWFCTPGTDGEKERNVEDMVEKEEENSWEQMDDHFKWSSHIYMPLQLGLN